jgi:hypothetical protein
VETVVGAHFMYTNGDYRRVYFCHCSWGDWRWPVDKELEDLRSWKQQAIKELEDLRSWKQQAIKANEPWDRVRELLGSQEFGLHCGDDLPKAAADWLSRCRSYLNRIRVLEDELKAAKEILNAPPCRDSVDQENAEYWKTRALIDEELVKKWEEKNFWAAEGLFNGLDIV